MGKTFVYNTGTAKPPVDELHVEIGVFFDGTLNNLKNTELRAKYRDGKNQIESTDDKETILKKEKAIEDTRALQEKEYKKLKNKEISDTDSEYERYLKASHRAWLDKQGVDNSFSNDYTNVARMYKCCEQYNYGVYVEGIGTLDNSRDVDDGFQYGSGKTGVRGKVRKGCEMAADRIKKLTSAANGKIRITKITIDTFGFSRGAAAARNFAYEINGNKRTKDVEIRKSRKTVGYKQVNSPEGPVMVPEYGDIWVDKDNTEVDPQYVINGKLPRFGFLGYYLLSKDILTKEELDNLDLDVRFIGVYDTVSSYEEYGDMGGIRRVGWEGMKHSALGPKYNFGDDVEQLQLLNPGSYFKAVHFTAANEHRENFSLTRFPGSIEKEFPGVHCDVGGAYENGMEVVDEIETSNHKPLWFLNKRRQQLIDEHWYDEEQIEINNSFLNVITMGGVYRKITGTRFLRKEYSYIPLHFMEEHGVNLYDHQLIMKTETSYSIEHDQYLPSAKDLLHGYVFEGEGKWNFKTDEEFEKEKQERARERLLNPEPEPTSEPVPDEILDENGNKIKTTTLQGVTVTGYHPQTLLRIIRNQYLHWSANRDWMGMDPNNDYQRRIYPE
ncbi:phospholipase effector Tle1 domain-containing protein [Chryseobacterium gallinarum]|uniref:DUF2235 domain-containing protein n=1 Tax=Chryseobacterium gallinarum TaxID=1324352 RepID=A0ABX6KPX7_CHRGL|nr:DUF2235 domain-containing protein [Chryseobacterium gallinarum]QIY90673.1 DUF2235 domain-containing protein [Chryseobacterium gallinarum]